MLRIIFRCQFYLDSAENTDGSVTFSFGDSSEGKDSSVKQAKSPAKSPTQQSTSETLPQNGKSETSPVIENSLNEVQKQSIKSQNEEDPKKTEESENLISEQANEVVQKVEEAVKEIAKVEQPLVTEGINGHSAISQNAPKTEDSDLDPKEALQQLTVEILPLTDFIPYKTLLLKQHKYALQSQAWKNFWSVWTAFITQAATFSF